MVISSAGMDIVILSDLFVPDEKKIFEITDFNNPLNREHYAYDIKDFYRGTIMSRKWKKLPRSLLYPILERVFIFYLEHRLFKEIYNLLWLQKGFLIEIYYRWINGKASINDTDNTLDVVQRYKDFTRIISLVRDIDENYYIPMMTNFVYFKIDKGSWDLASYTGNMDMSFRKYSPNLCDKNLKLIAKQPEYIRLGATLYDKALIGGYCDHNHIIRANYFRFPVFFFYFDSVWYSDGKLLKKLLKIAYGPTTGVFMTAYEIESELGDFIDDESENEYVFMEL